MSLLSRFLFDAVMEDDETCQAMFEIILGRELGMFLHTSSEKEFRKSPLFRSVCLDVCSEDITGISEEDLQALKEMAFATA